MKPLETMQLSPQMKTYIECFWLFVIVLAQHSHLSIYCSNYSRHDSIDPLGSNLTHGYKPWLQNDALVVSKEEGNISRHLVDRAHVVAFSRQFFRDYRGVWSRFSFLAASAWKADQHRQVQRYERYTETEREGEREKHKRRKRREPLSACDWSRKKRNPSPLSFSLKGVFLNFNVIKNKVRRPLSVLLRYPLRKSDWSYIGILSLVWFAVGWERIWEDETLSLFRSLSHATTFFILDPHFFSIIG